MQIQDMYMEHLRPLHEQLTMQYKTARRRLVFPTQISEQGNK
jgi:hypothetical protein